MVMQSNRTGNPKFAMGRLLSTPGALAALEEAGLSLASLLSRHVSGDWGDLSDDDKQANELALQDGSRIFSAYVLAATRQKVWCITEAEDDSGQRASTTILLPEDY